LGVEYIFGKHSLQYLGGVRVHYGHKAEKALSEIDNWYDHFSSGFPVFLLFLGL
jgi:hypothetical protein